MIYQQQKYCKLVSFRGHRDVNLLYSEHNEEAYFEKIEFSTGTASCE
jgi:hypothetical protein